MFFFCSFTVLKDLSNDLYGSMSCLWSDLWVFGSFSVKKWKKTLITVVTR